MSHNRTEPIQALSIAPAVKRWLAETEQAYILQSFKPVVNLVNQESNVLSVVNSKIGNGPFSAVIEESIFPEDVSADGQIEVFENHFWMGNSLISIAEADVWAPKPNWGGLRSEPSRFAWAADLLVPLLKRHALVDSLAHLVIEPGATIPLPARILQAAQESIPELYRAIARGDRHITAAAAKRLAGLGPGLTPAGDDLLLGLMHGLWATMPEEHASSFSQAISEAAVPRTHALSAAWLLSAACGEAAEPWHQLINSITALDGRGLEWAAMRILPTGHTSGADALGGFLGILNLKK